MIGAGPDHTKGWSHGDFLLERYTYSPGPRVTMPIHAHDEYHVVVNSGLPGEVVYRGARHKVAPGSLFVVVPGEVHAVRDPEDRRSSGTYRVLYAGSDVMREATTELAERPTHLPNFAEANIRDDVLVSAFLRMHAATERPATTLERDVRMAALLGELVGRHADIQIPLPRATKSHPAVQLARAYLEDNYRQNVSLAELAKIANLSSFQLARVFRDEVGMPPHAYQLQVRVERAKRLLLRGWTVGRVAEATGFFDESHLTRHFRRVVGGRPGSYAKAKLS